MNAIIDVDQSASLLLTSVGVARTLGIPGCQLRHGLIDPAVFKLVGADEAERLLAVPMFKVHGTLTVAMTEPSTASVTSVHVGC